MDRLDEALARTSPGISHALGYTEPVALAQAWAACYFAAVQPRVRRLVFRLCLALVSLAIVASIAAPMLVKTYRDRNACEDMWTKAQRCNGLPQADVDKLIASCEADPLTSEVASRTLACGKTCSQLDACFDEVQDEVYVEKIESRLAPLAIEHDWAGIELACRLAEDRAQAGQLEPIAERCAPYRSQVYEAWAASFVAARDAPRHAGDPDVRERELLRVAERLGPDVHARARTLVRELDARRQRDSLDDKLRNSTGRVRTRWFSRCTKLLDDLGQTDSDWARAQLEPTARLCFVELGAAILDADAPRCTRRAAEVIAGLEAHALLGHGEAVDARVAEIREAEPCPE